ncbi:hypothetical protein KBC89_00400 [Candidatus Woesebacteria bacterium]|nr:hypothetical protein [Candidatus Woesebacteria bacterium]
MTKTKPASEKQTSFSSIGSLFDDYKVEDKGGYITQEFQDFGYRLACELNDEKHKSLYIKMAKTLPRHLLEEARRFVFDAQSAKSKAKLFMWKLKQLRAGKL